MKSLNGIILKYICKKTTTIFLNKTKKKIVGIYPIKSHFISTYNNSLNYFKKWVGTKINLSYTLRVYLKLW